jgi:signal transduction histidine kinase
MVSEKTLKILILEDNKDDVYLIKRTLMKEKIKCEIDRVDSKDEFLDALRSNSYDVILSDHSLPQFNSSSALRLCRGSGIAVPFILVTGTVSEEFAVSVIRQGADDYVLKTNLSRLPTAILNALQKRRMEAEKRLIEIAIRQQYDELRKTNKELDSFVYSVSHNLRAPLLSVIGLLDVARRDTHPRDPIYDEYFMMIQSSMSKLDETIKEILQYSGNARMEVDQKVIDFEVVIQEAIERLRYMEGFDKVRIHVNVNMGQLFYSDPYRLSIIMSNLLSNAIKYRDREKQNQFVTIDVSHQGNHVLVTFQDNGIGIQKEYMGKIFNMFFRATEKSQGAGLGLYIVRETVSKLEGSIEARSEFGNGVSFTITLPAHKRAEDASVLTTQLTDKPSDKNRD